MVMYPNVLKLHRTLARLTDSTLDVLHHERQRPARLNVSVYELSEHIQANLVVRDSFDDANGQREAE